MTDIKIETDEQNLSDIRALMADGSLVLASQRGDRDARTRLIFRFSDFLKRIAKNYSGTGITYDEVRELALNSFLESIETWSQAQNVEFAEYALMSVCGRLERFVLERADHLGIAHLNTDYHFRLVKIAAQLSQDTPNEAEVPELVHRMVHQLDWKFNEADNAADRVTRLYEGVDIEMVTKLLAAKSLATYLKPAGLAGPFDCIESSAISHTTRAHSSGVTLDSDFDYQAALDEIDFEKL